MMVALSSPFNAPLKATREPYALQIHAITIAYRLHAAIRAPMRHINGSEGGLGRVYHLFIYFAAASKPENPPWNHLYLHATAQGYTQSPIYLRMMEGQVTLNVKSRCSISSLGTTVTRLKIAQRFSTNPTWKRDSVFPGTLR